MAQIQHPVGALRTKNISDELATQRAPLELVVVSPARPIWEGECRWLTVTGKEGQLGIWPRHADLVAALGVGRLRIGQRGGGEARFAIWGGFLKVTGNKVTILVDRAEGEEEVDEAEARDELAETIESLRHPKSDDEFDELLDRRRWCESRLKIVG